MLVGIEQGSAGRAVVAGLVVLQPMMADRIAQCVEEVILQVMMRAEERIRFHDQLAIRGGVGGRDLQISIALCHHVHHLPGNFSRGHEFHLTIMRAGNQRRIDQRGQ